MIKYYSVQFLCERCGGFTDIIFQCVLFLRLQDMWVEQWGEISPYNLVGVEQYLEEMHHVLNDCSLKKKCHNFLPFLFKV